jgi:peptidoglycan hydrolase-like protein with peptidoglycan-binding domain
MAYNYSNAELRNILNGLGFRKPESNESNFPLTNDNSQLSDRKTVEAIKAFQRYFGIASDGIVGAITKGKAEQIMNIIHYELDLVINPNPPLRPQPPLYGPQTASAVAEFRQAYGFEPDRNQKNDRVADLPVRRKLDELTPGINNLVVESAST